MELARSHVGGERGPGPSGPGPVADPVPASSVHLPGTPPSDFKMALKPRREAGRVSRFLPTSLWMRDPQGPICPWCQPDLPMVPALPRLLHLTVTPCPLQKGRNLEASGVVKMGTWCLSPLSGHVDVSVGPWAVSGWEKLESTFLELLL